MKTAKIRIEKRAAKHSSIRKHCFGTPERPRLCVKRTLKNIIVQVVDDMSGKSIIQLSSCSLGMSGNKTDVAKNMGKSVGDKLKGMGIEKVVFDRGGYVYHGRVRAVADGARESGLKF